MRRSSPSPKHARATILLVRRTHRQLARNDFNRSWRVVWPDPKTESLLDLRKPRRAAIRSIAT